MQEKSTVENIPEMTTTEHFTAVGDTCFEQSNNAGEIENVGVNSLNEPPSPPISGAGGMDTVDESEEPQSDETLQDDFVTLYNQGYDLYDQFKNSGRLDYLEESIKFQKQALYLWPNPHPYRFGSLSNLAVALQDQFQHSGKLETLEEAIELLKQALRLSPHPHPERFGSLNNLANALETRYLYGGGLNLLDDAIELHRQALQLRPDTHPGHSTSLNNLATALVTRFEHGGELNIIEEAVKLHKRALANRPKPHPDRYRSLINLANSLRSQYDRLGGSNLLEEAIGLYKEAIELLPDTHPDYSHCLDHLASALHTKFQDHSGGLDLLQEVIELHRCALKLRPHSHPHQSTSLNNLAVSLETQFQHGGGRFNNIEDAIELHKQALKVRLPPHPSRHISLSNLANALQIYFEHRGGINHLEDATELHRQALKLRPDLHPDHATSLDKLAVSLHAHFNHGGGLNLLLEAIELHKKAVRLIPNSHPKRSDFLNNLAFALQSHFYHSGELNLITEAVELHRQTLKYRAHPHPDCSASLTHLANALQNQFAFTAEIKLLEEAIALNRHALELRPAPHPGRATSLHNLALALMAHFRYSGGSSHLEEAIKLLEPLLQFIRKETILVDSFPDHHPSQHPHDAHISACMSLGEMYVVAYTHFPQPNDHLEKGIAALSSVSQFSFVSPFSQFKCATIWAKYADRYHHPSAMEAYDLAIRLLPQSSSFGYSVAQRRINILTHRQTGRTLASDASQYNIHMQRPGKAIEYTEAARAILWSQLLELRSPFDQLCAVAPDLGKRLKDISTTLECASHNDPIINGISIVNDNQSSQVTSLTREWRKRLEEARKVRGFEEFLLPHRLSSLQKAAATCPIAIPIPHNNGSFCLVMTSTTIHSIAIPNFTSERLRSLVTDIQNSALKSSRADNLDDVEDIAKVPIDGNNDRLNVVRTGGNRLKPDDVFRLVLGELWKELVKPVIDILCIKRTSNKPRPTVQWCPTGLFTFLPIHAAGIYTTGSNFPGHHVKECISNYIISSYTPTIAALLTPKPTPPNTASNFKMLAVISGSNLSHTKKELQNIKTRVPKECLTEVGVNGVSAHVETVKHHFPTSSIVHFACHGIQDKGNPLESGLALDDGMLTVAEIMKQPLPNGSLAFLCACETSMGDEELPDEAISIGASLVFSGFSSVIATMWRMMDRHGPTVADAFYEELFRGPDSSPISVPDFSKSAQALDLAVKKLRDSGVPFYEWVPFIHLGKAT